MAQVAQWQIQAFMLQAVADALGADLLPQVAFVGGCTTALLVTDAHVRQEARATEDVDVMLHVLGMSGWYGMQESLRSRGFRQHPDDEVICRMRLPRPGQSDLIVDFMPDDEKILGFSNRWYPQALRSARDHPLGTGATIRIVSPPYFLATKLEAWKGRGRNDLLSSRDVDDIFTLVRGRPALADELRAAEQPLRQFVAQELSALLQHPALDHLTQSLVGDLPGGAALLFKRLEGLMRDTQSQIREDGGHA